MTKDAERAERLKAALRDNLRRRKAQIRGRGQAERCADAPSDKAAPQSEGEPAPADPISDKMAAS